MNKQSSKHSLKRKLKKVLRLEPVECHRANNSPYMTLPNELLFPEVIRYIEQGKTVTIPLKGNSMRPFLCHQRDKALLCKCDKVEVGNPILAEISPGQYVLHRVVSIDGDTLTLLGDGNLTTEICHVSCIRALAYGFIRKGRTKPDLITSNKWKSYSWIWMHLTALRHPLLMLHHFLFRSLKILD